jgi:hypothetical protein
LPLERTSHSVWRVLDPILQDVNDFYLAGGVMAGMMHCITDLKLKIAHPLDS